MPSRGDDLGLLLDGLADLGAAVAGSRLVAIGWATVDIERTVADLAAVDARPTHDDVVLGARAWRTGVGPVSLLLLEPNTEGRLAATLARRGEGIAAFYLEADGPLDGGLRPTALGLPGRLMPGAGPWGPFLVLVSPSVPGGSSMPGLDDHPASGGG